MASPETTPPHDGSQLGHLSDAQLLAELARRRMKRGGDLEELELSAEAAGDLAAEGALAQAIAALPPEDGSAKPCPACGAPTPVKTRNRVRTLLTVAGELRLVRNYHYCRTCRRGFYPRDLELKLPETGAVSSAMERRILDFGINDTFQASAERFRVHYPSVNLSTNLVRLVVERVGRRCEAAYSERRLQEACRAPPDVPPPALVVAGDGSMLLTREDGWREAKVAVVARADDFLHLKNGRTVTNARYVGVLGDKAEFRAALDAALSAERADEVGRIVWLADGAKWNWSTASELCPFATQVLDFMHAVQNGVECGKALLGEADPLLPAWQHRLTQLLDADSPDDALRELMDCVPLTTTEEQLAALNQLVGYYRDNAKRMRYRLFLSEGLPIGSGIVESAHRHVLQVRMKRSGQRWATLRARRMVRMRAHYRTAGPFRFHRAVRDALLPSRAPRHPGVVKYSRWADKRLSASI